MRDYEDLVKSLRYCAEYDCTTVCPRAGTGNGCITRLKKEAADAIEELQRQIIVTKKCYQMMAEAYEAEVTKPKWISVEDALPEEDVEVLISYRYKEGEGDTSHVDIDITTYGQMYFGGREVAGVKHWRPPFEYFSSNYEVIAWMPLPEPPKEVSPHEL